MNTNYIQRAIELLRDDAAELARCHTTGNGEWGDEVMAKAAYYERLAVVAGLEKCLTDIGRQEGGANHG
jgi:hypothetical protein